MKFNPELQSNESNLAFEQIKHIEEDNYNQEAGEKPEENQKLEKYFDDGFGDNDADEIELTHEAFEAFKKANGISFETNTDRKHGNAA